MQFSTLLRIEFSGLIGKKLHERGRSPGRRCPESSEMVQDVRPGATDSRFLLLSLRRVSFGHARNSHRGVRGKGISNQRRVLYLVLTTTLNQSLCGSPGLQYLVPPSSMKNHIRDTSASGLEAQI
jgi:hypothetical protein